MTKLIPLNKGQFAIVDDEDYDWLSQRKWQFGTGGYAGRIQRVGRKTTPLLMHRVIMNAPDGTEVDHRNRNKLDNRKSNLRLCTPSQNQANTPKRGTGTSRYKGVSWAKSCDRWIAHIHINRKTRHVGSFTSELDAAKAYDAAAREYFGSFAYLNFPESDEAQ